MEARRRVMMAARAILTRMQGTAASFDRPPALCLTEQADRTGSVLRPGW